MNKPLGTAPTEEEAAGIPLYEPNAADQELREALDKILGGDADDDFQEETALYDHDDAADKPLERISEVDGLVKVGEARRSDITPKPADTPSDDDKPEEPATGDDKTTTPEKDAARPSAVDVDALLADVPEAKHAEIRSLADAHARVSVYDEIIEPFREDMARHGQSPEDAIRQLANLNSFATRDPGGYMQWYVEQVVPAEKRADALVALGKQFGVDLVAAKPGSDDPDDDIFADPEDKPAPKADAQPQISGEDRRQIANVDMLLTQFTSVKGPDGALAHPFMDASHPLSSAVISAMNAEMRADMASGALKAPPNTITGLRTYYEKGVAKMREAMGVAAPSAQAPAGGGKPQPTTAAATDRAKRASSTVTPSSQGAPRRGPAATDASVIAEGADIGAALRATYDQLSTSSG